MTRSIWGTEVDIEPGSVNGPGFESFCRDFSRASLGKYLPPPRFWGKPWTEQASDLEVLQDAGDADSVIYRILDVEKAGKQMRVRTALYRTSDGAQIARGSTLLTKH